MTIFPLTLAVACPPRLDVLLLPWAGLARVGFLIQNEEAGHAL